MDIFLANTTEDYAGRLERQGLDGAQAAHELDLSSRSLLYGGGRKVVILPSEADPVWLERVRTSLGYDNVVVLSPSTVSLRLCLAIEQDEALVRIIKNILEKEPDSRIIPYAVTQEYCSLCVALGLSDPLKSYEAAAKLDSKAQFREIFGHTELSLPEGFICQDASEVSAGLENFRMRKVPAVLKVHDGESGWGLQIFDWTICDRIAGLDDIELEVRRVLSSDFVWEHAPYIVEEYVLPEWGSHDYSPSGEGRVSNDGVQLDYVCHQVIDRSGGFQGIRMGKSVESFPTTKLVAEKTMIVGRELQKRGYLGSFDVDFVLSSGVLYALESNVRRTGGTHVFDVAKFLFGDNWRTRIYLSDDNVLYGDHLLSSSEIFQKLGSFLFDAKLGAGIIVSYVSASRPTLGIIVVGRTEIEVSDLFSRAIAILADTSREMGSIDDFRPLV